MVGEGEGESGRTDGAQPQEGEFPLFLAPFFSGGSRAGHVLRIRRKEDARRIWYPQGMGGNHNGRMRPQHFRKGPRVGEAGRIDSETSVSRAKFPSFPKPLCTLR